MSKREALALMPHKPRGGVTACSGTGPLRSFSLPPLLWRMAQKVDHERVQPKQAKERGHPKTKLTDAQVIEMRDRHENEGWSIARCAEHYGLNRPHCDRILDYSVRSNVSI